MRGHIFQGFKISKSSSATILHTFKAGIQVYNKIMEYNSDDEIRQKLQNQNQK